MSPEISVEPRPSPQKAPPSRRSQSDRHDSTRALSNAPSAHRWPYSPQRSLHGLGRRERCRGGRQWYPARHRRNADDLATIPDNRATRLPGKDLFDPDLIDLTLSIPAGRRYSFVFRGRNQQLDYMLVNHHFDAKLDAIAFASIERDLSDHAGLYAMFSWQAAD